MTIIGQPRPGNPDSPARVRSPRPGAPRSFPPRRTPHANRGTRTPIRAAPERCLGPICRRCSVVVGRL